MKRMKMAAAKEYSKKIAKLDSKQFHGLEDNGILTSGVISFLPEEKKKRKPHTLLFSCMLSSDFYKQNFKFLSEDTFYCLRVLLILERKRGKERGRRELSEQY